MKRYSMPLLAFTATVLLFSCSNTANEQQTSRDSAAKGTYAYDRAFLKKYSQQIVELQNEEGNARLLLSADYQGRVMTSTAAGDSGSSFGWLNYSLIGSGEKKKQFNPVGGEERFWLGPEGGQYSLYFKKGDSFNIAHWQVPPAIDTVPYHVASSSKNEALFTTQASLTNYSGTVFSIAVERKISLLDKPSVEAKLQMQVPSSVKWIGYSTNNRVTNTGSTDWKKDKGLMSIWLLSMMTPTPQTTVIIPFSPGKDSRQYITDNYFGNIPPDRLNVKDSVLYFTCDGKYRSKIGLSPKIAKSMAASYDFKNNVLTVLFLQVDKAGNYVNSKWELQKEPYKGDVVNSYNDGPLQDGTQMGPFYEIESSSPARELKKGEVQEYQQTMCHFQGDYATLRGMAKQLLGVDLDSIKH